MTSIKFQMLLVTRTYTCNADKYKGSYFTPYKVAVLINIPHVLYGHEYRTECHPNNPVVQD